MKKLTQIKNIYFIFAFYIFIFNIVFLKIEYSIKTKLHVSYNSYSLFVDSNVAYKMKTQNKVILKILNKYYSCNIQNIYFNNKFNLFEIKLTNLKIQLIPQTIINAFIIIKKNNIISFFLCNKKML